MLRILTGRLILVRLLMLVAMAGLVGIGIAAIYAAGNPAEPGSGGGLSVPSGAWKKQVVYATAGLAMLVVVNLINYRWLGAVSYWLYAATLGLLAVLLHSPMLIKIFGHDIK